MLHAVVPAGGSGTRLWPLSRAQRPKFLLPLTGTGSSLLQSTVERVRLLSDPGRVYVVTGAAHAVDVARQLPEVPGDNILVEPSPRDSAAAISLAAAVIAEREPTAVMGAFAADHLVLDGEAFAKTVERAMELAETGLLMTIGINPTGPDTGFGYLRLGAPVGPGYQLEAFVEKPDQVSAVEYVSAGNYLWNAGMFVWRVDVFLAELKRHRPALHDAVRTLAAAWDSTGREALFSQLWPTLEKISIDYAVMEPAAAAGKVGVVPGDFDWHDVGDYHTLGQVLTAADKVGNVIVRGSGETLLTESKRNVVVPAAGRLVAAVGVDDMIIVDTPDALLVCPRDRAQEVKALVEEVKQAARTDLV
ncbi:mannose-1-phosphate guanylyltransferase [Glycomyces sp. A-F 0318]|uniref:mannose-1-phosphate guanylyltransferase n=1 Tax=Glycomyces amatae TaxID=2881355 RepID=UPI001E62449D|nr:sugar phosphate nucleotidyltransferase [Glycomyces amatae]MCD0446775.1 mannose-1-phosphate guanylyltransferase [Glycomyces amatae]